MTSIKKRLIILSDLCILYISSLEAKTAQPLLILGCADFSVWRNMTRSENNENFLVS
jgi:hypothetical protein